ncbi:hypothetical protein K6Y31_15425 [Motilimonas cestriensis]|uniref:Uncharacterized protein n=1 Tax=Motilimonas cestriensis TaxID=2742685 RepID=A0ABS8WB03_9GAMM|nr:hypothetical protein [Motilimonas cestriensis]MCE2596204.1 hypothetical protein [Motilimonas cestriensis]
MWKVCLMVLSVYLCLTAAEAEEQVLSPPFTVDGVDPYSEDLFLYLSDSNKIHLAISVEGDAQTLLLNDQPPTPKQLQVLKKALTDLQVQGPIDPQVSQAVNYIIKLLNQ